MHLIALPDVLELPAADLRRAAAANAAIVSTLASLAADGAALVAPLVSAGQLAGYGRAWQPAVEGLQRLALSVAAAVEDAAGDYRRLDQALATLAGPGAAFGDGVAR